MASSTQDENKKVALVTGSTSGIGLQCAHRLANRGCDIIITGLGEQSVIDSIKQDISSKYGVQAEFISGDLCSVSDIDQMCSQIKTLFPGGVDILVNNAGINHTYPVDEYPDDKWDEMVAIMLSAPFHFTKRLLPGMKAKGWGRIVNMSSQMGLISVPKKAVYSAVKAGLIGLTKGVALENADKGITCNAVCPGYALAPVLTRQFEIGAAQTGKSPDDIKEEFRQLIPTGKFVTTDQIAELVEFLCFSGVSENMTGATYLIDQGNTAK